MKKFIIVSLLFVSLLSVPFFVHAQTATTEELNQQLITLLTQVIAQLQKQIADILASRSAQQAIITPEQTAQISVDSLSGPQKIGYCSDLATKQYQEASKLAEADKKKCEENAKNSLDSMICFTKGSVPDISSYYSACLGVPTISHNEPTSPSPLFTSPSPVLPAIPTTPSLAEQIKQKEMCDLVKGFYLGGHCY